MRILFTFFILFFLLNADAQILCYTYDNAGNRIKKAQGTCPPPPSLLAPANDEIVVTASAETESRSNQIQTLNRTISGSDKAEMHLYPNPTKSEVNLSINTIKEGNAVLSVHNVMGEVLIWQSLNLFEGTQNVVLDSRDWATGIYSVRLQIENEILVQRLEVVR